MVDVAQWLADLGLSQYRDAFDEHAIDGDILKKLNDDDLKELGVKALGHRKRLLEAIEAFTATGETDSLPKPVETQPARDAERRQLTLLFCDLVGSTELSGQLDPEELAEVMRSYQKVCQTQIARWGGHTAKFLGDGVLAYFGFPEAHEDDAERAVRAGLDLVHGVAKLMVGDRHLSARVGIATGLVIVGELIGDGASLEEAVIGETPNLAARLQALAEPGSITVSPLTVALIEGLFELEDRGRHTLKGFAEPVQVWCVAGSKVGLSRFAARAGQSLTPLVGRARELALFDELWWQATASQGQMLLISGEPGIGKSRLAQAIGEKIVDQPAATLVCQCSPFHTNSALHPVIELLEQRAGFSQDDQDDDRLDKMERLLSEALPADSQIFGLIASLLSLPTGRYPALHLSAQRQKDRTLTSLADYLEAMARQNPVLFIFEDVHWIDPTSLELLDLLAERLGSSPMLMILTYRPEFQPSWLGQSHVHTVFLNRLPKSQSATMVAGVTGGKSMPEEILEQIIEKTDGVPLFLEELTKTVLESDFIVDAGDHFTIQGDLPPLAIPTSLHDSLTARLDRFSHVKEVAQIGAAIGREFPHTLIASLTLSSGIDLTEALDCLLDAGLIFRRGVAPEAIYIFKHALVQDAAYQSLLIAKRQMIHAKIAQILIEQFDDIAKQQPEIVARHYAEAGLFDKAVTYWKTAGDLALRSSAVAEAVAHLKRGIRDLQRSEIGENSAKTELELQLALGAALIAFKGYAAPETGLAFERAVELCELIDAKEHLAPALYGLALFHMDAGRLRKSVEVAQSLLERAKDDATRILAHRVAGTGTMHQGDWQAAHDHQRRVLELYDPAKHQELRHIYAQDQRVSAAAHLSWPLLMLGHVDEAIRMRDQSIEEAHDINHPHSLAFALHSAYWMTTKLQDAEELKKTGYELVTLCDEHGFAFHRCGGLIAIGSALLIEGDYEGAIDKFSRGIAGYRATDSGYLIQAALGDLSRCHLRLGNVQESGALLDEALSIVEENEERTDEPVHLLLRSEIALALGHGMDSAISHINRGLELARFQKAKWWELRLSAFLAKLYADSGRREMALATLQPIYDSFSSGFQTRDLIEAKQLLDSLH